MSVQCPNFADLKIAVVGDVMLDRYWVGTTQRISPEAPVPVVKVAQEYALPGGAGNVARNLQSLGVDTTLFGVIGDDANGAQLRALLEADGICTALTIDSALPTITKLRLLCQHQQIVRIDFEADFATIQADFADQLVSSIAQYDALIISDYHKGTLNAASTLIAAANQAQVPVFVDPKGESFERYQGADFITPNKKEFTQVVGACESDEAIHDKALQAIKQHHLGAILVTRGAEGMTLVQSDDSNHTLPASAAEVADVTGAGDTVIAVFAASVASGLCPTQAMHLANEAAGLTVMRQGAAVVSRAELTRQLMQQLPTQSDVLTLDQAKKLRETLRTRGLTLVMTNGCFDILHPGHIGYLDAAKACGDYLLVAINTDASVQRLKGKHRPVKSLDERMAVLVGLKAVDGVVAFDEDTPAELIKILTPDVLVKGVDYKAEDIVGADHVMAHGGEVKIVGPDKRWSSSALIKKVQRKEEGS